MTQPAAKQELWIPDEPRFVETEETQRNCQLATVRTEDPPYYLVHCAPSGVAGYDQCQINLVRNVHEKLVPQDCKQHTLQWTSGFDVEKNAEGAITSVTPYINVARQKTELPVDPSRAIEYNTQGPFVRVAEGKTSGGHGGKVVLCGFPTHLTVDNNNLYPCANPATMETGRCELHSSSQYDLHLGGPVRSGGVDEDLEATSTASRSSMSYMDQVAPSDGGAVSGGEQPMLSRTDLIKAITAMSVGKEGFKVVEGASLPGELRQRLQGSPGSPGAPVTFFRPTEAKDVSEKKQADRDAGFDFSSKDLRPKFLMREKERQLLFDLARVHTSLAEKHPEFISSTFDASNDTIRSLTAKTVTVISRLIDWIAAKASDLTVSGKKFPRRGPESYIEILRKYANSVDNQGNSLLGPVLERYLTEPPAKLWPQPSFTRFRPASTTESGRNDYIANLRSAFSALNDLDLYYTDNQRTFKLGGPTFVRSDMTAHRFNPVDGSSATESDSQVQAILEAAILALLAKLQHEYGLVVNSDAQFAGSSLKSLILGTAPATPSVHADATLVKYVTQFSYGDTDALLKTAAKFVLEESKRLGTMFPSPPTLNIQQLTQTTPTTLTGVPITDVMLRDPLLTSAPATATATLPTRAVIPVAPVTVQTAVTVPMTLPTMTPLEQGLEKTPPAIEPYGGGGSSNRFKQWLYNTGGCSSASKKQTHPSSTMKVNGVKFNLPPALQKSLKPKRAAGVGAKKSKKKKRLGGCGANACSAPDEHDAL